MLITDQFCFFAMSYRLAQSRQYRGRGQCREQDAAVNPRRGVIGFMPTPIVTS
jgi:hypothetical protein